MYFCRKDRGEMASMVYNWESDQVAMMSFTMMMVMVVTKIIIFKPNVLMFLIIIIHIVMFKGGCRGCDGWKQSPGAW